jgi:hypothetical protein
VKPNKENIVKDILIELEKGISYNECLALNGTKWQLAVRTFARYWNTANEAYKEALNKRQTELDALTTDLEKERLKSAILTKFQRMEIASSIAMGKSWKSGGVLIVPTAGDRTRALDYLSKIDGDYAPTKTESEIVVSEKTIAKLPDGTELEI